ncbi:hypothetical protein Q8G38_17235 [Halomonas venusta]|uniref:hypothetical protein n=1 Tax=Vreelandella venusta TaxID=44935 RepID=UPI00295F49A4|nr:hypothetical protein [Halomonas venusta]MDW0361061.1 hypothetical protein [Halomonas venusta]
MAMQSTDMQIPLSLFPDFPVSKGHFLENIKMGIRIYFDLDHMSDPSNFKAVVYMHGSGGNGKVPIDNPLVQAITSAGYYLISVSGLGSSHSSSNPWTYGYGNVQSPMLYGRMVKGFWETQAVVEILAAHALGTTAPRDFDEGWFNSNSETLSPFADTRTTKWSSIGEGVEQLRVRVVQGEADRLRVQWRVAGNNITFDSFADDGLSADNKYQAVLDVPPGATHVRIYYASSAVSDTDPILSIATYIPIALLGHSLGAQKSFSWASLVHEMYPRSEALVDYIIGNGATSAGSGNYRWNHIHRNIAAFSNTFRRVNHKAIAYYSDDDGYCPRDFSERLRMSLRPDQDNLYFISPGALGHSWFSTRPDLVVGHLDQFFNGDPITIDPTDPDSALAVPGP